jgi:acyl-CoA thioester hydrolase
MSDSVICSNQTTFRVRYGETDQMGVVNNAQYASYFEIGRTEMFRQLGLSYAQMEKDGLMMPVSELFVKYYSPAFYDELLTIETSVSNRPTSRICFNYKVYNQQRALITEGYTWLAFLNAATRRPMRVPEAILQALSIK